MTVAWIGFAGAVIAALISGGVALRQARTDERVARLNADLETEVHRRTALIDRELSAEAVLARYQEPLAAAAYDLQGRLYNILRMEFFVRHDEESGRLDEGLRTTLFRFAQYFGWTEILRRDIQFLSFPEDETTRHVAGLQLEVTRCLLTDDYGHAMMIWSDQQRALGEEMIVGEDGRLHCLGYAGFSKCYDETFGGWAARFEDELRRTDARDRLRDLQHHLCNLVEALDPKKLRYSQQLERA